MDVQEVCLGVRWTTAGYPGDSWTAGRPGELDSWRPRELDSWKGRVGQLESPNNCSDIQLDVQAFRWTAGQQLCWTAGYPGRGGPKAEQLCGIPEVPKLRCPELSCLSR
tara:strand:+ start:3634 stop:3960 length:327 start_codon:yes stop_codon:yes gene_type:complete